MLKKIINEVKFKYYWTKGKMYARKAEKKITKYRKTNDEYIYADFRRNERACIEAIQKAVEIHENSK